MKKIYPFMPGQGWKIVERNGKQIETSEQCILYLLDKWLVENRNTNLECLVNGCKCHRLSGWKYSVKKAAKLTGRTASPDIEKLLLDLEDVNYHFLVDKIREIK